MINLNNQLLTNIQPQLTITALCDTSRIRFFREFFEDSIWGSWRFFGILSPFVFIVSNQIDTHVTSPHHIPKNANEAPIVELLI